MTKLVWDKVGDRLYEAGVDRGVLYLPNGSGVPWNGLTAVEEDQSDVEVTSYYFDGIKYLDTRFPGDFSGTLKAFTYPDEFMQFDGLIEINNRMLLGNQPVYEQFCISYRTRIGNDLNGTEHGYKIHIVYNITASPDNKPYITLSGEDDPMEFSWSISAVPEEVPGFRPTAHLIFDTTRMNSYLISDIETLLYGSDPKTANVDNGTSNFGAVDGGILDIRDGSGGDVDVDVLDGGDSFSAEDGTVISDGGTPDLFSSVDILDGEGPQITTSVDVFDGGVLGTTSTVDSADGGLPTSTSPDMIDGGVVVIPTVPVESADAVDGGTVETAGAGQLDGQQLIASKPSVPTGGVTTPGTEPRLLKLPDLVDLVSKWTLIDLVDHGDGTWSATAPDDFIRMIDETTFEITGVVGEFIDVNTYELTTTHGFEGV